MVERIEKWTFEVAGRASDRGVAWHAIMVRGMAQMAKEVSVKDGRLIIDTEV